MGGDNVYLRAEARRRGLYSLELELQATVSLLTWVLGSNPCPCNRSTQVLNLIHRAIFQALVTFLAPSS